MALGSSIEWTDATWQRARSRGARELRTPAAAIAACAAIAIGCGAKTGLEVGPRPPCDVDASRPTSPQCDALALGAAIAVSPEPGPESMGRDARLRFVESLDAVPAAGGAAVVYQIRDEPAGVVEIRSLAVDASGRGGGGHIVLASSAARPRGGEAVSEPSAAAAPCGRAALGALSTVVSDGVEADAACSLETIDGPSATVQRIGADHYCWDLVADADGYSFVHAIPFDDLYLERFDRDGGRLAHVRWSPVGVSVGFGWRRAPLADGFLHASRAGASGAPGGEVARYDARGRLQATTPLTDRALVDFASAVDADGATWILWSEAAPGRSTPEDVFIAPVGADGSIGDRVALASGGRRRWQASRIAWVGGRLLVPLHADEAHVVVAAFAPDGALVAEAALDEGVDTPVDLAPVDGGALLFAVERRFDGPPGPTTPSRGTVLVARALRCVASR